MVLFRLKTKSNTRLSDRGYKTYTVNINNVIELWNRDFITQINIFR